LANPDGLVRTSDLLVEVIGRSSVEISYRSGVSVLPNKFSLEFCFVGIREKVVLRMNEKIVHDRCNDPDVRLKLVFRRFS
jgi:hypothetical protein